MTTTHAQRQRMIRHVFTNRPDAILEVTVHLWEGLARELINIIGEGGFQSLYARSLHLTGMNFPWITQSGSVPPTDGQAKARFSDLTASLQGQDFTEGSEAGIALLVTFIEILALLIGDDLTTSILRSAWGDDALDKAAKEFSNE